MEYRQLGTTGIRASALCVGVAFRGRQRRGLSDAGCMDTIERAVERGINLDGAEATLHAGQRLSFLEQHLTRSDFVRLMEKLRIGALYANRLIVAIGERADDTESFGDPTRVAKEVSEYLRRRILAHIEAGDALSMLQAHCSRTELAQQAEDSASAKRSSSGC